MATGRFGKRRAAGPVLRVAVEGVIGVGKTTLANALADRLGAVRLFEDAIANPFLEPFYKHPSRYALPCQLCFLDGRLAQFAGNVPEGVPVVADHTLPKDLLFARVNLQGPELELYQRLYQRLTAVDHYRPRVVIYLTASLEEVRERIRRRGRRAEGAIDLNYLKQLVDAYQDRYLDHPASGERVVVVAADATNIVADGEAIDNLIAACLAAGPGLSYCNPEA